MGNIGGKKKVKKGWKKELKLVVLGIAASGKSTFTRQMRMIHEASWTQAELENFYDIICANVYDGLRELGLAMTKFGLECNDPENTKRCRYYKELTEPPSINDVELERIKALWADKSVEKCVKQMREGSELIIHNLGYFIERLDVIAGENYIPSDDDILHCRQRSTGATETCFIKDKTRITLIDMGGQRPERAKWEKVLADGVKGVFYFVALDEFNVPSTEEKGKTKLEVSLEAWKDLLTTAKLTNVSIILLFNKIDLLDEKLKTGFSCVLDQFPNYKGEKTKDGFLDFIRDMFVGSVPDTYNLDFISNFVCCALDTALMGKLFTEAQEHIVRRALAANGL
eukprot:TRINITY_DN10358_c0_g1_i1.p1 TRINITY_DN10358_c0_g1~~TRINITY_DN10358_c0_g1_i1.p1  ORF type:complete len:364 (-),score=78.92 TRINITY_DN10358_c0_g1_i1:54-1076(-)